MVVAQLRGVEFDKFGDNELRPKGKVEIAFQALSDIAKVLGYENVPDYNEALPRLKRKIWERLK